MKNNRELKLEDVFPDVYYHYTSVEAFYSIITTKEIWATDYRFLNDSMELEHGINKFLDKCGKEMSGAMECALAWHKSYYFHCVFSLSKSPAVLSQWRAYADDAKGVAIGFRNKYLPRAGINIFDCIYSDIEIYTEELIEKHKALISDTSEAASKFPAINEFWRWVDDNKVRFDHLVSDLLRLKNPAFSEELEIRAVISVHRDKLNYRVSNNLLIPYFKIKFWDDEEDGGSSVILRQVWLGPKCEKRNITSMRALIDTGTDVKIYDCGYL